MIISLALGQSYDCPSASEVIMKNMGENLNEKRIHWWHDHNNTKHSKTVHVIHNMFYESMIHMK